MHLDTLAVDLFALVIFAAVLSFTLTRANTILNQWAAGNGYQLLERHYAWLFKGPFFWTSNRSQVVFRIVVQDQAGSLRHGWVRCGSWWGGILSNEAEVRWDE